MLILSCVTLALIFLYTSALRNLWHIYMQTIRSPTPILLVHQTSMCAAAPAHMPGPKPEWQKPISTSLTMVAYLENPDFAKVINNSQVHLNVFLQWRYLNMGSETNQLLGCRTSKDLGMGLNSWVPFSNSSLHDRLWRWISARPSLSVKLGRGSQLCCQSRFFRNAPTQWFSQAPPRDVITTVVSEVSAWILGMNARSNSSITATASMQEQECCSGAEDGGWRSTTCNLESLSNHHLHLFSSLMHFILAGRAPRGAHCSRELDKQRSSFLRVNHWSLIVPYDQ